MKILSYRLEIEVINKLILSAGSKAIVSGHTVKVAGARLRTFATKGVDCVCCCAKGSFYRVEDNYSGAHLNLYAIKEGGREVLMTRDHIIPKSHGGSNGVSNMAPMCVDCNNARGTKDFDKFLSEFGKTHIAPVMDKDVLGDLVVDHINRFGFDSHLRPVWVAGSKRKQREAVLKECIERGDETGTLILEAVLENSKKRRRVKQYARPFAPENTYMCKDKAFGILMTLSRKQLDNPSEANATKLRIHLEKCKDSRR